MVTKPGSLRQLTAMKVVTKSPRTWAMVLATCKRWQPAVLELGQDTTYVVYLSMVDLNVL